jgi:phosphohistidine swiveling domain-containing protein
VISKQAIVAEPGQSELLRPDLVAHALTANDQAKYYFALLQAASANADAPHIPVLDLKTERLTAQGARTSHAAVVAHQTGRVCVVGCHSLKIDQSLRAGTFGDSRIEEGEALTVDGSTAAVSRGTLSTRRSKPEALLKIVRTWR